MAKDMKQARQANLKSKPSHSASNVEDGLSAGIYLAARDLKGFFEAIRSYDLSSSHPASTKSSGTHFSQKKSKK